MAEQAVVGVQEAGDIFVYMGGDKVVPDNVRRVRIDKSVKIIPRRAFRFRRHLIDVEFHDGIETIEQHAFIGCQLLRGSIQLLGVKVIEKGAFYNCIGLEDIEFGETLETFGSYAFFDCTSLRNITMPSVRNIGNTHSPTVSS